MLILNSKKYDIMITNKLFTTKYNNEILIRQEPYYIIELA